MSKRRILSFVRLLWCLLFALSLLGCAAPMVEHRTSWSLLPTAAEGEADRKRLAIPSELRKRLHAINAQSCKAASNTRPNPALIGQTYRDPIGEARDQMLLALLKWGIEQAYEKTPEERAALLQARQMVPPAPIEWQPSVPVPEAEAPLLEHPIVQFSEGALSGGAIGAVPFGPMGAEVAIELRLLPKGTYWARVGKACGEIVVGTGQIILGCAGIGAGVGMSGTGGGAAVGVPVVIGSVPILANGCATAGHGLAEGYHLFRDGDVPSESPAQGRWVRKKAAEKPTQSPVAEPAPAAKPATTPAAKPAAPPKAAPPKAADKPAKVAPKAEPTPTAKAPPPGTVVVKKSEGGTITKTRQRAPAGKPPPETTVTITTNSTGSTTTTTVKGKPSATSAGAAPVAKGAKRGPKTDPEAAHNAAIRNEAKKLEAQGNKIVAGGGDREKVVKITGGIKTLRRPDIIYRTPDGKLRGRNVGKTKADGTPVKREVEALDDLNNHSEVPTDFVPYDR